ncbi:hypothetical protein Lser_V15G18074 [Lactuca serriola]
MSSSSSSDSTAVEDGKFIGSVMVKTVAYYQNRLAETSRARSKPRKSRLRRNNEVGHDHLIEDYFADDASYTVKFRRRFWMKKELFLRIVGDLEGRFPYFQWKMNGRRIKGVAVAQEYSVNRREVHNRNVHHALRADLVEHIYKVHIQPPLEFSHDDLFDESNEDSDMFVESEDSDDESDAGENDEDDQDDDEDDEGDDEDDDSE